MLDTSVENKGESFYIGTLKDIQDNYRFNLIKIYDKIKDFTPETHFIKISEEESLAIVDCFSSLEDKSEELTKDQAALIRQIEQKVETLINEKFKGRAFFTKLYQRSFKDGRSYHKINHMEAYEKEYEILRTKWSTSKWRARLSEEDWEENLRFMASEIKIFKSLKCTTTKELMNLMLTSTKNYLDLEVLLEYGNRNREQGKENELLEENYLNIREWVDMSIINEYRCLVYKNNFICMSQYDCMYYDHLESEEQCEKIKNTVVKFWREKVKEPLSSYETYDVDIAILEDGSLLVIELNCVSGCDPFCMKEEKEKIINGEIDLTDWNDNNIIFKTYSEIGEDNVDLLKDTEMRLAKKDKDQIETYDVLLERVESKRKCLIY
jgi:hypothetical protein